MFFGNINFPCAALLYHLYLDKLISSCCSSSLYSLGLEMELYSVSLRGINLHRSTTCTFVLAQVSLLLCELWTLLIKILYLHKCILFCTYKLKLMVFCGENASYFLTKLFLIKLAIMLFSQSFVIMKRGKFLYSSVSHFS